jgi:hypothetical protein
MPETNDLLTVLRDVGVPIPDPGDAGEERIRAVLQREIAGPRRARWRFPARRRSTLRFSMVGAAVAIAAGVVVASGALSATAAPRLAFSKALTSSASPATTEDTAYIIKRVKANIATSVENGTVVRYATYTGGDVAADGSLINLGRKLSDAYEYVAPDGTSDSRSAMYYSDGTIELTSFDHWTPGLAGRVGADIETVLNPTTHTYSRNQYRAASNLNEGPSASLLFRTPAQVQQALQSGEVIRHGTATVDGTQVIALSLEVPNAPGNPTTQIALYVDARTYQPLRTVSVQNGAPDLNVGDWNPATRDNIALAKDRTIPAGYTKASLRQVYDGTYNH